MSQERKVSQVVDATSDQDLLREIAETKALYTKLMQAEALRAETENVKAAFVTGNFQKICDFLKKYHEQHKAEQRAHTRDEYCDRDSVGQGAQDALPIINEAQKSVFVMAQHYEKYGLDPIGFISFLIEKFNPAVNFPANASERGDLKLEVELLKLNLTNMGPDKFKYLPLLPGILCNLAHREELEAILSAYMDINGDDPQTLAYRGEALLRTQENILNTRHGLKSSIASLGNPAVVVKAIQEMSKIDEDNPLLLRSLHKGLEAFLLKQRGAILKISDAQEVVKSQKVKASEEQESYGAAASAAYPFGDYEDQDESSVTIIDALHRYHQELCCRVYRATGGLEIKYLPQENSAQYIQSICDKKGGQSMKDVLVMGNGLEEPLSAPIAYLFFRAQESDSVPDEALGGDGNGALKEGLKFATLPNNIWSLIREFEATKEVFNFSNFQTLVKLVLQDDFEQCTQYIKLSFVGHYAEADEHSKSESYQDLFLAILPYAKINTDYVLPHLCKLEGKPFVRSMKLAEAIYCVKQDPKFLKSYIGDSEGFIDHLFGYRDDAMTPKTLEYIAHALSPKFSCELTGLVDAWRGYFTGHIARVAKDEVLAILLPQAVKSAAWVKNFENKDFREEVIVPMMRDPRLLKALADSIPDIANVIPEFKDAQVALAGAANEASGANVPASGACAYDFGEECG